MSTLPDNDLDRQTALNPEMPECVDCGAPTSREDPCGKPQCADCADKQEQAAWERQQEERVGR